MAELHPMVDAAVAGRAGAMPTGGTQRWVQAALAYLAVTFLAIGMWATFSPRSFYDGFPGGGRHWLAGDGPYNAHLTSDAGVGFLAVGVVVVLAAVSMERRVAQAASVAVVIHAFPHLVFHLGHPNRALGWADTTMSNGGLVLSVLVAVVVFVAVSRARPATTADGPTRPVAKSRWWLR